MPITKEITLYNKSLDKGSREICDALLEIINSTLSQCEAKVWHGAPVWFLNGNPLVGYSKKKVGVELLFWSGQSFDEEKLTPVGNYKASGIIYRSADDVKKTVIKRWLTKSKKIQWDYANLSKNRKLVRATQF